MSLRTPLTDSPDGLSPSWRQRRSAKRGNFNSQSRFILAEKQKKLVLKKNEYRQAPLLNLRDLTEPKNKSYIFQTDRA